MKRMPVLRIFALLIAALLMLCPSARMEETPVLFPDEIAVDAVDEIMEESEQDFGNEESLWMDGDAEPVPDEAEDPIDVTEQVSESTAEPDPTVAGETVVDEVVEPPQVIDEGIGDTVAGSDPAMSLFEGYEQDPAKTITLDMISVPAQEYTGAALTPEVTIEDGGKKLTEDVDYTLTPGTYTDAGAYPLTVTGKGNYTGTLNPVFYITQALTAEMVTVNNVEYTGSPVLPAVTVKYKPTPESEEVVVEPDNYVVAVVNQGVAIEAINVGQYTAKVTGQKLWAGEVEKTFNVTPKPITLDMISVPHKTYTGGALSPDVTIVDGVKTLILNTDYTLSEGTFTNAGTHTLTVTGKGNYGGTVNPSFVIDPKALTADMISVQNKTYDGNPITVTVTDNGTPLAAGTDYTIVSGAGTDAGDYTLTLQGIGNYIGTATKTYSIAKADREIEVKAKSGVNPTKTYDKTRNLTVTENGVKKSLLKSSDFEFTNVANGDKVTITQMYDVSGSNKISPHYDKVDAGTRDITVYFTIKSTSTNYNYKLRTDHITITGTINPKTLTLRPGVSKSSTDSTLVSQTKVYGTKDPSLRAKVGGLMTGDESKDAIGGSLTRESGEKVGKYKVLIGTVKGKGNYAETVTLEEGYFVIEPKPINATDVGIVAIGNQIYTGSAIEPAITLKYAKKVGDKTETETLVKGIDFEVVYANNVQAGTATATIIGKGNYTDTRTVTFRIGNTSIEGVVDRVYTGKAIEQDDISVTWNGLVLENGKDYTLSYENNTNVGRATVIVNGMGNLTGSIKAGFNIKRADRKLTATYIGQTLTKEYDAISLYNGSFRNTDFQFRTEGGEEVDDVTLRYVEATFASPNAGTQTVTLKIAIDPTSPNYNNELVSDTLTVDGVITPYPINRFGIGFSVIRYTGAPIEPEIPLRYFNTDLVKGTDYDIAYSNNVEPGLATITVTGKGNFGDTLIINFQITPISMPISDICIICPSSVQYTGKPVQPDCQVLFTEMVDGALVRKTLVKNTDYEMIFGNNIEPGPAIVTVVGKGRYAGTCTSFFYITKDSEGSSSGSSKVQGPNDGIIIVSAPTTIPSSTAPTAASDLPTIPATAKVGKAVITAPPGAVYRLNSSNPMSKGFKSSNKKVATVDQNGCVTIRKAGKTKITFKVGKKKRTVTLTVKDPTVPGRVTLTAPTTAAKIGDAIPLTVSLPAGTSSPIKWTSSNRKVATVVNGVVVFKKAGRVTITATATRGKKKARVTFKVSK